MPPGLRIEEFQDRGFARSLRAAWEGLEKHAGRFSPNVHPDYAALWLERLGRDYQPKVITAWNDGELVGYAPLMTTTESSVPFSMPKVRFIGNNRLRMGDFYWQGIVARAPQEATIKLILAHLKASRFAQKWEFGYMAPASPTTRIARAILKNRHAPLDSPRENFPILDLPADWETYLKRLHKNARGVFRRGLRRLEEQGDVRIQIESDSETVSRRVSEMIRNHDRWWIGTQRGAWFGDDSVRRFYVEGAQVLARHRQYLSAALELDGVPIAWDAGPTDGTRFYSTLTCFDQTFRNCSPGFVMLVLMIRELITRGIQQVELGPGSDRYKFDAGGVGVSYARIEGYPSLPNWIRPPGKIGNFLAFKGLV